MGWWAEAWLNYIVEERIWLIFILFSKSVGRRWVDRQSDRLNMNSSPWRHDSEWNPYRKQHFHPFCCWDGKKRSYPSEIFTHCFNLIPVFAGPSSTKKSRCLLMFLLGQKHNALRCDLGAWCPDIIESYVNVLRVIRVSTRWEGKNSIFFFFSLGLQSFSRDSLRFNDTGGLSAVQLVLHKVFCEALRAMGTKQMKHFCEALEGPLSWGGWSKLVCCWAFFQDYRYAA